jgi:hypothetical protein
MTMTDAAATIFRDAYQLHAEALERLEAGNVRDAADKAWCATLRATNGLILARTGEEPVKTPNTSRALDSFAERSHLGKALVGRYYSRQSQLHGDCFYSGMCEPMDTTIRRIQETAAYIQDAERLADG